MFKKIQVNSCISKNPGIINSKISKNPSRLQHPENAYFHLPVEPLSEPNPCSTSLVFSSDPFSKIVDLARVDFYAPAEFRSCEKLHQTNGPGPFDLNLSVS